MVYPCELERPSLLPRRRGRLNYTNDKPLKPEPGSNSLHYQRWVLHLHLLTFLPSSLETGQCNLHGAVTQVTTPAVAHQGLEHYLSFEVCTCKLSYIKQPTNRDFYVVVQNKHKRLWTGCSHLSRIKNPPLVFHPKQVSRQSIHQRNKFSTCCEPV